ncbi:accelerated cell death 11-like [Rhododendron vialii]|uniref:accelerated cell death 11-like n=1 Tax=Rhododendron vialii TaxID=182163 RepID=UPI00265F609D|nr:accelerated cell death 11-like [Rhododendron vialii]
MAATDETVLTKIAEAFNELADDVNSPSTPPRLSLSKFCSACRLLSPLIGCMGIACRFAEIEFSAKVDDLTKASESIDTIEALIDLDIAHSVGKISWSNSRNLIRANRTVDLLRIMFEQILAQRGNFITGPGLTAYELVFAPYHSLAIKTAVRAVALTLPTKAQLLRKLKENEASANVQMQKFVIASSTVIQYINNLFHSKEYADELLEMI